MSYKLGILDTRYMVVVGPKETDGICNADIYTVSVGSPDSWAWAGHNSREDLMIVRIWEDGPAES
jgi:hypothetical protein